MFLGVQSYRTSGYVFGCLGLGLIDRISWGKRVNPQNRFSLTSEVYCRRFVELEQGTQKQSIHGFQGRTLLSTFHGRIQKTPLLRWWSTKTSPEFFSKHKNPHVFFCSGWPLVSFVKFRKVSSPSWLGSGNSNICQMFTPIYLWKMILQFDLHAPFFSKNLGEMKRTNWVEKKEPNQVTTYSRNFQSKPSWNSVVSPPSRASQGAVQLPPWMLWWKFLSPKNSTKKL